jgi:hypothetical protein
MNIFRLIIIAIITAGCSASPTKTSNDTNNHHDGIAKSINDKKNVYENYTATTPRWNGGFIKRIYIDSSDVVVKFGKTASSPCGSNLYHIQRRNDNFNEFYLMVINAISSNLPISVQTTKCSGNRNITSHGYIENNKI